MATTFIVWILVNLCGITIDLVDPKPVPDLEMSPGGCVHSEQNGRFVRSLGASDGKTPYVSDRRRAVVESQTNQEHLGSVKVNDVSSASLNEPINYYYRGQRGRDPQPVPQTKLGLGDQPKEEGSPLLPGDEQVACYEQQNIDPTVILGEHKRPLLKLQDQRPFAEAFQNEPRLSSRPLFYKEKDKHSKHEEDDTITSLYSDPEKRSKVKQEKTDTQTSNDEVEPVVHPQSVYKPVGVRPEFPVYDEDIDFHPDPLQGILEDKYWLDPQEQEAVIRKYIDLANNNMQPPGVDHVKREAEKVYESKSVDSKEAFRDPQAECPCREVSACKDCSRGKWKKKYNSSVVDDVGTYEKRKLLSIDSDNGQESHDKRHKTYNGADNVRASGAAIHTKDKSYETEKDSSEDYGVMDLHNGEESQGEREVPSYTSNYFGRKLLSLEEEGDKNEEYDEEEYSEDSGYKTENSQNRKINRVLDNFIDATDVENKVYNRRSVGSDEDSLDESTQNEKHYNSPVILNTSNSGVFEFKLETENVGPENKYISIKPEEGFIPQKPLSDKTMNMAKYYVPNKLGNFLQKTFKQKSRYKTTIDPDLEFAIIQNRTFVNVSIAMDDINISMSTEPSRFVKKRREQPIYLGVKGRRSYQIPLLKHQNIKKLQGTDDSVNVNAAGGNAKSPTSSPGLTNTTSEVSTAGNGSTANTTNTTSASPVTTTEHTKTTEAKKKKKEEYDEDTFDAEIANDIVETVIAESQSGSVVGHNLGLCRRNESISKYAKVSPESEMLLKKVTECILDHIRDRLEGQSCTLLDDELLQFLKWMVLSGESYRDYLARRKPDILHFRSEMHDDVALPIPNRTTAAPPTTVTTPSTPKTKRSTTTAESPQY